MPEEWERELEAVLAAKGVFTDLIELPPQWGLVVISADPAWCKEDARVGNYLVTKLHLVMIDTTGRRGEAHLGNSMNNYLALRPGLWETYVKPLFAGSGHEMEYDPQKGIIYFQKPHV